MKAVNKGFTLIELMIVVAIVAILAAIALPAYQSYTDKAKMTELMQASSPIKSALEIYAFEKGTFVGAEEGKNGLPAKDAIAEGPNIKTYSISTAGTANGIAFKIEGDAPALEGHNFIMEAVKSDNGSIAWYKSCTYTGADKNHHFVLQMKNQNQKPNI
ncbi:prepilin-type N-terminal cleavage/methylation domain-containing protein [Plesiomonas shigelloides subsp. oncorhynchi]|nr:prepilin-type N-terminal cleavage/methylation domain-containing protein [Plesiomonas shigelloides]